MNLTTFNRLMKKTEAKLHPPEWKMFLELCDQYLKRKGIKNPTVAETGMESRSEFFEQLFNAKYLGQLWNRVRVDYKETIDILLIDGGNYKDVKKNFEMYAKRCTGIIAIYDIESCRYKNREGAQSWRVWEEIKIATSIGAKQFENFLFLAIHRKRIRGNQRGIGVIIKQ